MRRTLLLTVLTTMLAHGLSAQAISPEPLRTRLFALADDSMMGRDPGTPGNFKAAEYVAAEFRKLGLTPAGDSGGWYQRVPLGRNSLDPATELIVGGSPLKLGVDYLPVGQGDGSRDLAPSVAVYGGMLNDPSSWISAEQATGKVVVLFLAQDAPPRQLGAAIADPRLAGACAVVAAELERLSAGNIQNLTRGQLIVGAPQAREAAGPMMFIVSVPTAERMVGSRAGAASNQSTGVEVKGRVKTSFHSFDPPARNVVAVLPGSDPALRGEFVSITAHNDHVGLTAHPVEHDSIRAYDRVVRPMGADSPARPATADEQTKITAILDSLRKIRPARPDSILNGADDDGTGTVALLEIAGALSRMQVHPRRSILFVSHTAEELGLLGSRWFTDHPTVPRDSIVAELDMDMIGRGSVTDLPKGGPGYLEVVGVRRLSTEFGDTLEAVNARQPVPFLLNYEYDAPGHPLQYYCRADHYSYARYGIPATALSRGEHLDYHQVTDEPQYIDYAALARVANLVHDVALQVANMSHRPLVNQPHGDPSSRCVQ
ncbi:MAG: M28 family peptidase [Gemmatimonadota bacterium]